MFEDYPKEIMTKDGTPILLRPLVPEDEQCLADFFSRIPENERWFLREDLADPAVISQWIQNLDYNRIVPIVAVRQEDGAIIGNVRLHRRPADCLRHIAHLRIMVDPEYRQQRIGTWMLLDTIKLAMNMGIETLVAEFVEGVEDAARNAAHKLDFFQQAVLKDYVKDRQGKYRDLIIMTKTLQRDWSDF
ncbi:MAG: GNAT family N-acetyltransferase [Desulfomonile tiedjei]|uniref:GNAT family N-acetyltransferase n=1 Tax=Desulfomonile tiedjei TaxID=2358 RepID=A0A9D6Z952_9BACT|nr:GNAT family N-acetyltransferase [Desulfomonile tiedjei]